MAALVGTDPDLVVVTGDNMAVPDGGPRRAARPATRCCDLPGAFVFGSNDYRGPVWKNPLRYLLPEREYVQGVELPYEDLRSALRRTPAGPT